VSGAEPNLARDGRVVGHCPVLDRLELGIRGKRSALEDVVADTFVAKELTRLMMSTCLVCSQAWRNKLYA